MKVTYSTENINSFGGINFADSIISNISVYKTIDTSRGSECAEDITEHLHGELSQVKSFDVCSADTLLRMHKKLATEKKTQFRQRALSTTSLRNTNSFFAGEHGISCNDGNLPKLVSL